jgi:hypothetical protein
MYETLRMLAERKLVHVSDEFQALGQDFRLLRIPLEKHEITSQGQLKQPLQMQTASGNIYTYDKTDPKRAHIMPHGITRRGSVWWQVLDVKANAERLVERRELSDRFLSLWLP